MINLVILALLQYEERTDDITMIALFLDDVKPLPTRAPKGGSGGAGDRSVAGSRSRQGSRKISVAELTGSSMANVVAHASLARLAQMLPPLGGHAEPGRRQRKARRAMTQGKGGAAEEDDAKDYVIAEHLVPHTEADLDRIDSSVKVRLSTRSPRRRRRLVLF